MQEHLDFLGWKVEDTVTGYTGVVTHVGLDLFGCVQAIVQPPSYKEKDGSQKYDQSLWFDVSRLLKVGRERAMQPVPQKGITVTAGCDRMKPTK